MPATALSPSDRAFEPEPSKPGGLHPRLTFVFLVGPNLALAPALRRRQRTQPRPAGKNRLQSQPRPRWVEPSGNRDNSGMSGDLRSAVDRLTREVFPVFKRASEEPHRFAPGALPEISGLWSAIVQAILDAASFKSAEAAVRGDPIIAKVIESSRLICSTATGGGSVLQAETLPIGLVQAACMEHAVHGGDVSPGALAARAVANVDKLRAGLEGDEITIETLIFFSGVLLEPERPIETPWGNLICADRLAAEIFPQAGMPPATAVLAVATPTMLAPQMAPEAFNHEAATRAREMGQIVTYAVGLGSNPEDPAGAMLGVVGGLLPFGMPGGGRQVRTIGVSSRTVPLSDSETCEIARWMADLDAVPLRRIEVALRRLVRALTERVDRDDVIIDAVIAWENLVEHRDAPTASVLWGIRNLTNDAGWSRRRIEAVYKTRSDIIHGDSSGSRDADARDAVRIGLDATRQVLDAARDDPTIPKNLLGGEGSGPRLLASCEAIATDPHLRIGTTPQADVTPGRRSLSCSLAPSPGACIATPALARECCFRPVAAAWSRVLLRRRSRCGAGA